LREAAALRLDCKIQIVKKLSDIIMLKNERPRAKPIFFASLLTTLLVFCALIATGASATFPESLRCEEAGSSQALLHRTGESSRSLLNLKIYRLAHYTDIAPQSGSLLADSGTKQMRLLFEREIEGARVRAEFLTSLRARITPQEWEAIAPTAEAYCAPFVEGKVSKGDLYVVTWLPDGTLISRLNGQHLGTQRDAAFARALWSIWFGERSVVDPLALAGKWRIKP